MVYGNHMPGLLKTTVYLDREDYARLKSLALRKGQSPAALVRVAVSEYAERHRAASLPASLGLGHSGRGDLSERAELLLAGLGDDS